MKYVLALSTSEENISSAVDLNVIPMKFKDILTEKYCERLSFNKGVTTYISFLTSVFAGMFCFSWSIYWAMSSFRVMDIWQS
jgi:hypothetical protein